MELKDFDYTLPKELIAQYPCNIRDGSRLLVLDRKTGTIIHRLFRDIVEFFGKGDLLVLNNTKVVPVRLFGRKETGGKVEVLILNIPSETTHLAQYEYEVLIKPARACRPGMKLIFNGGRLIAELTKIENGRRYLRFDYNGNLIDLLKDIGEVPLPPYIKRRPEPIDTERYQTVYASKDGAIAAPTAGLHFTKELLDRIIANGVEVEFVTLHVGYGTFKQVESEDITRHIMEKEFFEVDNRIIEKLKNKSHRVIAVGTTTCRVLETLGSWIIQHQDIPTQGWTDLFIYPGYRFKIVDCLLTNFHLPRTTLLMLVSAFCGRELLMMAYQDAIKNRYRFYSYGDAMLII